jgi:hypothetical protein
MNENVELILDKSDALLLVYYFMRNPLPLTSIEIVHTNPDSIKRHVFISPKYLEHIICQFLHKRDGSG